MKYIIALFFIVSAGSVYAAEPSQNALFISACRSMPEFRERAVEFHAIGYVQKTISVVAVSSSCGVVGCSEASLVVTRFEKNSVNPQKRSIIGLAKKSSVIGDITCELVELN